MSALAAKRIRMPRISPAVAAVVVGLAIVLGCGWLWLRDSSLVSVKHVRITGVSGPDASAIRGALRGSALTMTTLDVNIGRLRNSVEPYPDVVALSVSTQFPHGIVIHVTEQIPVATVIAGGRRLAVDASGMLMRRPRRSDGQLPGLRVSVPAGATRVTGAGARTVLEVLAAAPWSLIAHIATATDSSARGLVVSLRNGPSLLFGDASDLRAKWAAAIAVLADRGAAGATYIDVSDPVRPAAGASTGAVPAAGAGSAGSGTGGPSSNGQASTTPSPQSQAQPQSQSGPAAQSASQPSTVAAAQSGAGAAGQPTSGTSAGATGGAAPTGASGGG